MSGRPPVSIIIPTLNAGAQLEALLDALQSQSHDGKLEIIAVDSGSTDGTRDRLRARGVRLLELAVGDFNHGETRNLALSHARGELAVLLVQDALPASPEWLQRLLAPMANETVAGSFGRQQPWPAASRLTTHYLSRWVAAQAQPRVAGPLTRAGYARMTPAERHATCAFDNVCACVRLSVWRRHPFPRTAIAEDLQWAARVLLDGYSIAYSPDAVVWHSHDRSVRYELERTYLVHQQLQRVFGLSTVPTASSLLRSIAVTLATHVRIAAGEPRGRRVRAILRGAGLAVAMPLGQYLGAKSSREERAFLRVRGV
jgi:rhamnosyltransferase